MMDNGEQMLTMRLKVIPEWIDILGHMNLAAYVTAFDRLVDVFWFDVLKLQPEPSKPAPHACFVIQNKISYFQELKLGEQFDMTLHLLDYSEKAVHFLVQMFHSDTGRQIASSEQLGLHVDLVTRQTRPFPPAQLGILVKLWGIHEKLPRPSHIGTPVGIKKGSLTGCAAIR